MPLPLAMGLAGLASAGIGAWQSNRAGRQAQRSMNSMAEDAERRRREQEAQARQSRGLYEAALGNFNPQQFVNQTAGAAYQGLNRDLNQANAQRMAGLNARGLMGSNLGGARMQAQFNNALAERLAGLAMQAGGMEQQRIGMMGNLAHHDAGQQAALQDAVYGMRGAGIQQRAMGGMGAGQAMGQIGGTLLGASMGMRRSAPAAGTQHRWYQGWGF